MLKYRLVPCYELTIMIFPKPSNIGSVRPVTIEGQVYPYGTKSAFLYYFLTLDPSFNR